MFIKIIYQFTLFIILVKGLIVSYKFLYLHLKEALKCSGLHTVPFINKLIGPVLTAKLSSTSASGPPVTQPGALLLQPATSCSTSFSDF